MGYDASSHLIVGVRLSNLLTSIETKTEEKPLYDQFSGKPNGRTITVERKLVTFPNNAVYEIGVNLNDHKDFKLNLSTIAPEEDEIGNMFLHKPSYEEINLTSMIYGIEIKNFSDRKDDVKLIDKASINSESIKVKKYLEDRFGFNGEIQIFTMLKHSY